MIEAFNEPDYIAVMVPSNLTFQRTTYVADISSSGVLSYTSQLDKAVRIPMCRWLFFGATKSGHTFAPVIQPCDDSQAA